MPTSPPTAPFRHDSIFLTPDQPIHVSEHVLGPHASSVAHHHDFFEIAIIAGGTGHHACQAGTQTLEKGCVILLRPGAWHSYQHTAKLHVVNCCLNANLFQNELAWAADSPALARVFWHAPMEPGRHGVAITHLSDAPLDMCLQQLNAVSPTPRPADGLKNAHADPAFTRGARMSPTRRLRHLSHLLLVLAEIADSLSDPAEVHPRHAAIPSRNAPHDAVIHAMRHMDQSPAHPWTMAELARRVGLDDSYLIRLFRQATGLTPMRYLARIRVEHAATLLVRTTMPISDVGRACGWDDPNYFARRFKSHHGMSATQYRRRFARREGDLP